MSTTTAHHDYDTQIYLWMVKGWSFEKSDITDSRVVNEDCEDYSKFLYEVATEAQKVGERKVANSFEEALAL